MALVILGYQLIMNKEETKPKVVQNLLIAVLVITAMPNMMLMINDFTKTATTYVKDNDWGVEETTDPNFTFADRIILDQLTDLRYLNRLDWDMKKLKGDPPRRNNITTKAQLDALDWTEKLWSKGSFEGKLESDEKINDSLSGAKKEKFVFDYYLKYNDKSGQTEAVQIEDHSIMTFLIRSYYRYHIDFVAVLITLGAAALVLFFTDIQNGKAAVGACLPPIPRPDFFRQRPEHRSADQSHFKIHGRHLYDHFPIGGAAEVLPDELCFHQLPAKPAYLSPRLHPSVPGLGLYRRAKHTGEDFRHRRGTEKRVPYCCGSVPRRSKYLPGSESCWTRCIQCWKRGFQCSWLLLFPYTQQCRRIFSQRFSRTKYKYLRFLHPQKETSQKPSSYQEDSKSIYNQGGLHPGSEADSVQQNDSRSIYQNGGQSSQSQVGIQQEQNAEQANLYTSNSTSQSDSQTVSQFSAGDSASTPSPSSSLYENTSHVSHTAEKKQEAKPILSQTSTGSKGLEPSVPGKKSFLLWEWLGNIQTVPKRLAACPNPRRIHPCLLGNRRCLLLCKTKTSWDSKAQNLWRNPAIMTCLPCPSTRKEACMRSLWIALSGSLAGKPTIQALLLSTGNHRSSVS